ncbi:50S ribosomal protein L29 [Desulfuromonas sp. AOP6]|uniref:50S ribosomal protein L29 n=1 Tax=Desulfuromonas sp. AOP6 TaxID=1566351 RepID=UPI00127B3D3A|nr:50S ribosomal protein L29 [Desulfuromonas sp. AOP6]BCA80456.1 50S ribosomal protein L29 [Desulfuromonas sp. AOP6]
MKANELTNKSVDDLKKQSQELSQELFNLRFQMHTGHLENTARISQIKKDIARVNTVLRQLQA